MDGSRYEGRGNNLDALRFALAVLVIASHSYPLLHGDNSREPLMRLTGGQLSGGELAVGGFFVLSGFLIARSWERSRSAGRFFARRIARIYPGYLFAVLFGAFVVAPRIASDPGEYWHAFRLRPFALSTLNLDPKLPKVFGNLPVPAVNGSLWSIRYEFLCYLGVAGLGLCGAFRHRILILSAWLAAWGLQFGQVQFDWQLPGGGWSRVFCDSGPWPRLACLFLSGVLFHVYRNVIPYSAGLFAAAWMGLVAFSIQSHWKMLPLALPVLGGYCFLYLAFLPVPRLQCFARRGDISYGLYLYAFPVQQWLVHDFGNALNPVTLFLASFPITALLAAVSWRWIERPFLSK